MSGNKKMTFEEAFDKLEKASEKMEQENISLEEAMKNYEESIKYLNICKQILDESEGTIKTYRRDEEEI